MTFNKNGFTLAEVLITLTILGVVAALVIPNMMQRYQEKVTVSKVKKAYTTMHDAYNIAQIENGPVTTWDIGEYNTVEGARKIYNIISKYLDIAKNCDNKNGECFSKNRYKLLDGRDAWFDTTLEYSNTATYFILKDGTAISIWSNGNENCRSGNQCISFSIDINGPKGPNKYGVDWFTRGFGLTSESYPDSYIFQSKPDANTICNIKNTSDDRNGSGCLYWILYKGNMDYLRRDISEEFSQIAN